MGTSFAGVLPVRTISTSWIPSRATLWIQVMFTWAVPGCSCHTSALDTVWASSQAAWERVQKDERPPHVHRVHAGAETIPSHLLSLSLGTGTEVLAGGTGRWHQSGCRQGIPSVAQATIPDQSARPLSRH